MRPAFALCGIALGVCGSACAASTPLTPQLPHVPEPVAWTSYAGENQLQNSAWSRSLTRASVPRLAPVWRKRLDGRIFASPLAFTVGGRRLLFVSTEAGSVYALNAGDGSIVWQRNVGTVETGPAGPEESRPPVPSLVPGACCTSSGRQGCSTPSRSSPGTTRRATRDSLIAHPDYEYVWGGLRIAAGRLYVPVASYCDVGAPDGFFPEGGLFVIPLEQPDSVSEWDAVPGEQNLGGIWGWGGVSVDPDTGAVYTAVGNSHSWSEECACYVDGAGYGNHVVALTPDLTAVLDAQSPGIESTGDYDFGAAPMLFQPNGCPPLAAANNKNGTLYLWDRTRLSSGPIAVIPVGDGVSAFVGTPAWSEDQQTLYSAQAVLFGAKGRLGNGVRAFRVQKRCRFVQAWANPLGDGNQATPLVVGSDVLFATGGTPGGFYGLSAKTGGILWKFPTSGRTVAVMITVGGTLFGADTDGTVYAFRPRAVSPH